MEFKVLENSLKGKLHCFAIIDNDDCLQLYPEDKSYMASFRSIRKAYRMQEQARRICANLREYELAIIIRYTRTFNLPFGFVFVIHRMKFATGWHKV